MSSKETRQCFVEQQREGESKLVRAHRLEVAHLRWDKRCLQSRAAGLPRAAAARRLFQHAAQNRAYHLIISALSHKEELGVGVPYLHSPPPVLSSCSTAIGPASFQPHRLVEGSSSSPLPAPLHPARLARHNPSLAGCLLLGVRARQLHGTG